MLWTLFCDLNESDILEYHGSEKKNEIYLNENYSGNRGLNESVNLSINISLHSLRRLTWAKTFLFSFLTHNHDF